ncbi:MAG: hypothetical protein V2I65_11075 [Paracoccaceae bacterium]|jgi:hypothetical protein|nr:hypothetical protein [Paracoccaceae bacterium]
MGTLCTWIAWIFGALCFAAIALLIVGTFGLFGQERDPLSGVFLMPLGLPWNRWIGWIPDEARAWAAAAAPLLNLAILSALCRFARRALYGGG